MDYHVWGAMLHLYQQHQAKPKSKTELQAVLQSTWERLPQAGINKAVLAFRKRLQSCVAAAGKHIE